MDNQIKKGDLVLSGNGVVGVVENVQKDYSKVLSIMDSNISMSFNAVRNEQINGIASQNINSEKFRKMEEGLRWRPGCAAGCGVRGQAGCRPCRRRRPGRVQ